MSEEYPEKLAEKIDKLDFNSMDFAEEMIDIWNLAQKELISEFVEKLLKIEENRLIKDYPVFENLLFLINEYQEKLQ